MTVKSKIRHIALRTSNPEAMSAFYEKVEKAYQIPGQHSEYMVHDVEGNRVDVMVEDGPH